jgi:acetate kinase
MNILIVNAGSSSLKFQLIKAGKTFDTIYRGIADGIGKKSCFFKAHTDSEKIFYKKIFKNHEQALKDALDLLIEHKIVEKLDDINAIGHRVVHGGEMYQDATVITPKVKDKIKELSELAPLHNPPNLEGINACEKLLPKAENGTSHKYVAGETYRLLKKKKAKIVTCHLGNGSSLSAIVDGKCIDTSMGFTPLEGVPMGTRCGSIDPAIPLYIMEKEKISTDKIDNLLNHRSGIFGISQISSDLREIRAKAKRNNKKALFTIELLAYKIACKIGAYAAAMNGIDAITFTAGIGQNAWYLRKDICKYLKFLGAEIDPKLNRDNKEKINKKTSKVKIFVIKTNEGLQIAQEVIKLIQKA